MYMILHIMYIYTYIYACMYVRAYASMYACMYACIYVSIDREAHIYKERIYTCLAIRFCICRGILARRPTTESLPNLMTEVYALNGRSGRIGPGPKWAQCLNGAHRSRRPRASPGPSATGKWAQAQVGPAPKWPWAWTHNHETFLW
jgi:hypothetical protein